jgi:serine/threonine protein kinase
MSIQCPACLENNPLGSLNCLICGYSLTESNIDNKTKNQENNNSSPHHLKPNTLLLNGRYQIIETLGEGGFGITYKGVYVDNQAMVAIKELWPEKSARVDQNVTWSFKISPKEKQLQINKFKLEAQNQQKCVHPNIPKVYDCFEENNTVYIVMEFIEGKSLLKILQTEGVLPETKIKKYFIQVAEALKLIHSSNFLHRDIKPENIIINPQDNAILIDFGGTKEFIDGMTSAMSTVLTPGYAPYEQYSYKSKRFAATDIYALCSSMYELLTGKLPTEAPERVEFIYQKKLADPLPSPRQLCPEISFLMENIILTGLKIRVEDRFQTADELISALQSDKFISPIHKKAREFVKQKKLIEAIKAYEKCIENEPNNMEALTELALVQIHVNPKDAEITANKALKYGCQDGRIYGILGLIACHQNNWKKALSDLQKANKLLSQQVWIITNLAWALGKNKKWQLAETTINEALSLDNNNTFALGIKAWILVNQEKWKESIPPATQAIFKSKQSKNPDSQKLQKWIFPYLIKALKNAVITKNALDVERKINDYCQNNSDSTYAWGLKGWLSAKQGNWQEALSFFLKSKSLSMTPSWVLINLGIVYENLNKTDEAINIYQEYAQKYTDNYLIYYRLGTLLGNKQQWYKAKEYLEKARTINDNSAEICHNLGWILLNWKKIDNENINSRDILSYYSKAVNLYSADNSNYCLQITNTFTDLQIQLF